MMGMNLRITIFKKSINGLKQCFGHLYIFVCSGTPRSIYLQSWDNNILIKRF